MCGLDSIGVVRDFETNINETLDIGPFQTCEISGSCQEFEDRANATQETYVDPLTQMKHLLRVEDSRVCPGAKGCESFCEMHHAILRVVHRSWTRHARTLGVC